MPYRPAVTYHGDQYIAQGIGNAAGLLSDAALKAYEKMEQTKKQDAFGDEIMDHLSKTTGPSGKPYVPFEILAKYHAASSSAKAGMVQAAMANAATDATQMLNQQRLTTAQAQRLRADRDLNGSDNNGQAIPLKTPDGQEIPGQFYVPGAKRVISTLPGAAGGKGADTWTKIDSDLHAASGFHISDFQRSSDTHRFEKDAKGVEHFVADVPGDPLPPGIKPEMAVALGKKGPQKIKIPRAQFESFLNRVNALPGGAPAPAAGAAAAPAAGAGGRQYTAQENQALQWVAANPDDPRSPAILKKLGVQVPQQ